MKTYLSLLIAAATLMQSYSARAQKDVPHDTAYIETYPGSLTARVYSTLKYASLKFPSSDNAKDLRYTANAKIGVGVGATYNNLTLNIAVPVSNKLDRGKTKGLDLQLHIFPYKWAIDASLTSYKGNYISPKGYGTVNDMGYYYRNDAKLSFIGVSAYRVPNADKFSYRAAMIQNEWQKKSAGSLLYGGEIYYGQLKGDSSLVPSSIANHFSQAGINDVRFISVGPGVGYAYTLVAAKHLFLTGSLVGNLDINFTTENKGGSSTNKVSVDPVAVYKAIAGYNSSTWSVSFIVAGNALLFKGDASDKSYYLSTGNFKLFIAKKIMLKH